MLALGEIELRAEGDLINFFSGVKAKFEFFLDLEVEF